MNLKIFQNEEFRVGVVKKNNEIMFRLRDVAEVLGIKNYRDSVANWSHYYVEKLTNNDLKANVGTTDNRILHSTGELFLTEAGLYKLIFKSRKPEAEKFQLWVTGEVLPSIRNYGAYMTPETIEKTLTNPDFIIQLASNLKIEQEKRRKAEKVIEEQKPKVLFADSVSASNSTILIRDLAKLLKQNGIDTGEKRLFNWLRENGYLIKHKKLWI